MFLPDSRSIDYLVTSSHALEKEMATHSSVLAWRIPGMGEPGDGRAWWAAVYGVAQSCTRLKKLSSSISGLCFAYLSVPGMELEVKEEE